MAQRLRGAMFECHPEVSFWAMNDGSAMRLPKKASRRNNPARYGESGPSERAPAVGAERLQRGFPGDPPRPGRSLRLGRPRGCLRRRMDGGAHLAGPRAAISIDAANLDELGLDMAIWA